MAKKFLYFIAIAIVLIIGLMFALSIWSRELTEMVFVPTSEFVDQDPFAENIYDDPTMWIARPGMGVSDPSQFQPDYAQDQDSTDGRDLLPTPAEKEEPRGTIAEPTAFAVFFIHPTSYITRDAWNAPLDDKNANDTAKLYVRAMASPFAFDNSEVWAPRYRQATIGAFLTDKPEAQMAIDAAYRDVEQAFDLFLQSVGTDQPIVLAGHSQGSLHLLRLIRERVAGTELLTRIAAAYAIGWPISVQNDLPQLGLNACANPGQSGCVVSWSSFAEPADPSDLLETYAKSIGFDGNPRGETPILCSNPLTGGIGGNAPMTANLGTLVPKNDLSSGELVNASVPARCDERGLLMIGDPPDLGSYVLPGNNYHVYDIPLFWANLRADAANRVSGWAAR